MRSVHTARSWVLPDVKVSKRSQDTAFGAALFAARLLAPTDLSGPRAAEPVLRIDRGVAATTSRAR